MTPRQPPRLGLILLHQLVPDDDPLVGDLIEMCAERSSAWFWRQALFIVLARAIGLASTTLRQRASLEGSSVSIAMLIVLSFQVVVAGSLLNDLLERFDLAWITQTDHQGWLTYLIVLSFVVALVIGHATSRLHHRSRVAVVLVYGVSAALAALVTLSLLNPTPSRLFFPSAALQTAAAMVFVIGLLVGLSRRSLGSTILRSPDAG